MNEYELDTLKELISIGAGHCVDTFYKMSGLKVKIETPNVSVIKLENTSEHLHLDKQVTAVICAFKSELNGFYLMLMEPEQALQLSNIIAQHQNIPFDIEDIGFEDTILKELGNILCGTTVNAFGDFLKISIKPSIPDISTDMADVIVNSVVSETANQIEDALIFETEFNLNVENVDKDLQIKTYYLFYPESTERILEITAKHAK